MSGNSGGDGRSTFAATYIHRLLCRVVRGLSEQRWRRSHSFLSQVNLKPKASRKKNPGHLPPPPPRNRTGDGAGPEACRAFWSGSASHIHSHGHGPWAMPWGLAALLFFHHLVQCSGASPSLAFARALASLYGAPQSTECAASWRNASAVRFEEVITVFIVRAA